MTGWRRWPLLQLVLVYSTRGPRRPLRSVQLVEGSWGTAYRPQSWRSALVRCERLQNSQRCLTQLLFFCADKLCRRRPIRGLVLPLDVPFCDLRRSLQIHCLLVCYRPLASPDFCGQKTSVVCKREQCD